MLLSRKWLNEFVQVEADDKEFSEAMTLSGSKVENTEVLNASLKNVVAGRIIKLERHPDSDHMWVCQIDVGEAEPVQIVTGAWNIHEGDLVPVAKHNSLLPGGMKIEKGKLRGVVSNGMLCSLKELNLTVEHDYLMPLSSPQQFWMTTSLWTRKSPPSQRIFSPDIRSMGLWCAAGCWR